MADKLTPKQRLFVLEYLVDLNATQAAIRAGYSQKTAEVLGYQLLKKPLVAAAVEQAMQKREKRIEITADRVLQELARIGFSDLGDFVDIAPTGIRVKTSDQMDTRVLAEVSETFTVAGGTVKIKLHDKVAALEKLGRHLKLFTEKHEHSGPDGGPIQVDYTAVIREELARRTAGAPKSVEEINQAFPLPAPPPGVK